MSLNPFHDLFQVKEALPEIRLLITILKLGIVVSLIWVVNRYYTKNRLALLIVALIASYFLFL